MVIEFIKSCDHPIDIIRSNTPLDQCCSYTIRKSTPSTTLTIRATLNPSTSFSSGDPKHEDTPIPGCPALATAVSATQSPTELPIASTVRPSIAVTWVRVRQSE